VRGEYGHDFVDELPPLPNEPVIDKPGFGAFHSTDLAAILAARGVTHLIFTGVTTQCCVHSTLREAVDRGFSCLLLEDCCAAFELDVHRAAVDMVETEGGLFGWVGSSEPFVRRLRT